MRLLVLLLSIALATPLAAFDRGNVYLENRAYTPTFSNTQPFFDMWLHFGWKWASPGAAGTILTQNTEIFTADTELGEIAPMRSANFLVAARWSDPLRRAKLIELR